MKLRKIYFSSGIKKLNKLRKEMNAELKNYFSSPWEEKEAEKLKKGRVIGSLGDLDDNNGSCGPLTYMGERVVLYIKDQQYDPKHPRKGYKFHISKCETIQRFITNNRINRYVISTRTDGKFYIDIINKNNKKIQKDVLKELKVCKKCLIALNYKGYNNVNEPQKRLIYENFTLKDFFEDYESNESLFDELPDDYDTSASTNVYTPEGKRIADKLKSSKNWRCEKCGIDLSQNKKFLHVHHINGVKSDNRIENLKVLCIQCHAEEPGHKHLKLLPEYKEFINKFGSERN